MYYVNIFFIYAIIGYIYEILLALFLGHKIESGFMYGPWTPIFGIGVLIILFVSRFIFKNFEFKTITKYIIFFLVIITILTLMELLGGILLKVLFNKEMWNYSKLPLHIGKYISVEVSLVWGIFSLIILKYIHPKLRKITTKIPKFVTLELTILFLMDLYFSFKHLL